MRACIVVAGGSARRMGGVDKPSLRVGDETVLDHVLGAAAPLCPRLIVVGPVRPTRITSVIFTIEKRPGDGPVPAVLAGMAHVGDADVVVVLAADLPLLSSDGLSQLVDRLNEEGVSAAAASDEHGSANALLAAYRAGVLRAAATDLRVGAAGMPASRLLPDDTVTVDLGPLETLNVNTPADLAAAIDAHREQER